MKYTKNKLRLMLKDYFTQVSDELFWGGPEPEEINRYMKDCRFAVIENYSWGKEFPGVDVLFVLTVEPQNYQAFTIVDGKLVELHQEHLAAECLACIEHGRDSDDAEAVANDSQPF